MQREEVDQDAHTGTRRPHDLADCIKALTTQWAALNPSGEQRGELARAVLAVLFEL